MNQLNMAKQIFPILLGAALLGACTTTPTGRTQLAYMPESDVNKMGIQAFEDLKQKTPVSTDAAAKRFVNCVAQAVTRDVGGDWEVVVFEDKTLNAFALPGNKIGVHTGLVELVDNPDQLATVIGHEIGHVQARHSNERMSQKTAVDQGLSVIQAIASPTSATGQAAVGLLGVGAQYGVILPYSRLHESEADIIGLELMAKAGFDPQQSVVLWQKMEQASQGQTPAEFLSTHPAHDTRIEDLKKHMPKALQLQQQAISAGKRPQCKK